MRSKRVSKHAVRQKAARAVASLLKRKIKPTKATPARNAKQVKSNTRKINKLMNNSYGDVQKQVTKMNSAVYVTAEHPLCIQVNNPSVGATGPQVLRRIDGVATEANFGVERKSYFDLAAAHRCNATDREHVANGPRLKLNYVKFEWRFRGFLDDTRVKVQIVRQKKMGANLFAPGSKGNFMPATLDSFSNTCGWSEFYVPSMFQILKTQQVYFNSRKTDLGAVGVTGWFGIETTTDANDNVTVTHASDHPDASVDATTVPVKYLTTYVPLNEIFTGLNSDLDESGAVEDFDMTADANLMNANIQRGVYGFANQLPWKNVWAVVTTDDVSATAARATGDGVRVDCIRTCVWRDPEGGRRDPYYRA